MCDDSGDPGVTRILADLRNGDPEASARLLDLVYEELRALAGAVVRRQPPGQTLQPTALVHEAFLRMVGSREGVTATDRAHFLAVCATVMRRILADHARRRQAAKRGGGWQRISLSDVATPPADDGVDIVLLDAVLRRLAALNERQARVVECRFLSGMTVDEVASALDVSRSTVESDWRMARAWLSAELGRSGVA